MNKLQNRITQLEKTRTAAPMGVKVVIQYASREAA